MKEPGCRVGKIRVQIQRRQTKNGKAEKRSHWSLLTSSSTPTAVPRFCGGSAQYKVSCPSVTAITFQIKTHEFPERYRTITASVTIYT